ncbi:hypothetical protein [Bifidobacterium platyrrhinorum]|uniref:Uncharacterized protein n=1 Tax=Bifidobacterium platyrrhinorum TaxID=2661628 RepID=A0A6L9SVT7_9BIFI|nr:hypothetical protein [Bifidobacterium platyrrhinorum]NEG56145.1 hypothetical protein [Bifidobacterium platyrrhinorum]
MAHEDNDGRPEPSTPITLHISAVVDDHDVDLASVEVDMPIVLRTVVAGPVTSVPKLDSKAFTRRLTAGVNAFVDAFHS